jgi:ABC-2 type transport system permease protein
MTTNTSQLNRTSERNWSAGLGNLSRMETAKWVKTRQGVIHLGLWMLIINGLMAIIISTAGEELEAGQTIVSASIDPFIGITSWFTAIGVSVIAMGAIVGEKRSGVAAWILSAPVSRTAYFTSKLAVIGFFSVVTMVVIPGFIVFAELSFIPTGADVGEVSILPWIATVGALALNVVFYLSLTLFLGTVLSSRGAVVGIPIGFVFAGMFLGGVLPEGIAQLTPWAVVSPLAMELAEGAKDVTSYVPAIASAAWTVALIGASIWRFNREEF